MDAITKPVVRLIEQADELRTYLESLSPTEFHSYYKDFDERSPVEFDEFSIPLYVDVLLTNGERNSRTWAAMLRKAGIYYDFDLYDELLSSFLSMESMWIEKWRWDAGTPELPSRPFRHQVAHIWGSYGTSIPTVGIEPEIELFLRRSPYFSCDYIDNSLRCTLSPLGILWHKKYKRRKRIISWIKSSLTNKTLWKIVIGVTIGASAIFLGGVAFYYWKLNYAPPFSQ